MNYTSLIPEEELDNYEFGSFEYNPMFHIKLKYKNKKTELVGLRGAAIIDVYKKNEEFRNAKKKLISPKGYGHDFKKFLEEAKDRYEGKDPTEFGM